MKEDVYTSCSILTFVQLPYVCLIFFSFPILSPVFYRPIETGNMNIFQVSNSWISSDMHEDLFMEKGKDAAKQKIEEFKPQINLQKKTPKKQIQKSEEVP